MARVTALAKDAALKGEGVPGEERVGYEDFYSDYALKLVELSRTWNPAINPSFGAYMNTLLPLKYSGILETRKKKVPTKSISEETTAKKVGKIAGGVKATKEKIIKQKSKFKKFFVEGKGGWDPAVPSGTLVNKFRHAVQSAFRTAGDMATTVKGKPKLFLDKLEKSFENDMFKTVKNAFGTRKVMRIL